MSRKIGRSQWMALLPLSIMIATIILNILFRQHLYQMGIDFIYTLQAGSNKFFDLLLLFITMVIDPTIIFILTLVILLMSKQKQKAIVIFIFILLNAFLAATLKAYYKDPRPIWTGDQIRNIGIYCPIQYGNPSGHSWFSATFGFGLLVNYRGFGKNYINLTISILLIILVPFSRMYLGAHSLNQVLQGVVMGLGMCIIFPVFLRHQILQFLWTFLKQIKWKIIITIAHCLYIIPFLLGINSQFPPQWDNNIQVKCGKLVNEIQLNFLMFLANGILINLITGIGLGYSFLFYEEGGATSYLLGRWDINEQSYQIKKGKFYYYAIQILFLASGLVVGLFITYFFMNYKIIVFISLNVGAFVSGFIYLRYTSPILYHWKIIRELQPSLF